MNLLPLLLAVSVFFLVCGLWMAYWDLHPVRTDKAGVPTPADGKFMMSDRVALWLSVACSLLLHAGIVGALLLVGNIAPGTGPFPGADPMATGDDFYVLLTSLPEEKKQPPNSLPTDSFRPSAQATTPALPTLTVRWGGVEARIDPPAPPRAVAVAGAPAGASTNEGPPPKKVAEEGPTAAPAANDEASPRFATKRERVVELFSVRALKPTAERLVPVAPLSSSVQNAQPEPLKAQSAPVPPASKPTPEAPPLPVPDSSAVASRPVDAGPSLFPPPGTAIAAQPATSSSSAQSVPPSLRQAESASPPIVAAARPSASESLSPSQDTRASASQTPGPILAAKSVQEVTPLLPKSKVTALTPEMKRQSSPSSDATLQEPGSAERPPEFHAASKSTPVPTSGDLVVAAESPELGPAVFPPPGAAVAGRSIVPSASVTSVASRPPASEQTEVRQGTHLADLRIREEFTTSPDQASSPLPEPFSSTEPTLREPREPLVADPVDAFAAPEVVVDPTPADVPESGGFITQGLNEDLTRVAEFTPSAPEALLSASQIQEAATQPAPLSPSAFFPPPGTAVEARVATLEAVRSHSADLSLQESEEGPGTRVGSASTVEEVAPDQTAMIVPDSPTFAAKVLGEDPARIASIRPPAEIRDTHLNEMQTLETLPADATPGEPEGVPFDHPVEGAPAAQAVSESPTVATPSEPVVSAEPFDAGPALFPPLGAVVAARDTTVSALVNSEAPRPPASEPREERQGTQLAELQAPEVLPAPLVEGSTPRPPIPVVSPQDLKEEPDQARSADPTPQKPEEAPHAESVIASAAPDGGADWGSLPVSDEAAVAPELDEGAARIAAALLPTPEPPAEGQGTSSAEGETPEDVSAVNPTSEVPRVPLIANVSPPTQDKKPLPSPSVDTTSLESMESPGTHSEAASRTPEGAPDSPAVLNADTTAAAAGSLDAGPGLFPPPGTAITVQTPPSFPLAASASPRQPAPDPKEMHHGTQVAALEASEPLPAEPERSSSSDPRPRRSEETAIADSGAASLVPEEVPDSSSAPAPQAPAIATSSLGVNATPFPPPGAVVEPPMYASPESTPGLADGRGIGRLNVRLDGPRSRVTEQQTETISGKVRGGVPARVVLYVNDVAREIDAEGGSFQVSVSLQRGPNRLRAVAEDWLGMAMEDAITIEYVPPPVPNGIAITSPQDGHTLPPDAPPIILVEGQVADWNISSVWLVANGRRIPVRTQNGRFRKALPLLDPLIRMWAEIPANAKPRRRSQEVTVRIPSRSLSYGLLVMSWPSTVTGDRVQVNATWRARPERLDVPVQGVPLKVVGASQEDTIPQAFALRPKGGVYTFLLRFRAVSAGDVRATLYLPEAGHLKARELRPVSLNGTSEVVLAKVLLPQGVFWEQDEWFTGQSESADTVTKFRFPEGISWTERKEDLQ